jgi:hypothetical protein
MFGEWSAPSITVRRAESRTAISSSRGTGHVSSVEPDRTWNGRGSAASSSTRSGSVHNWRPVARSWAGRCPVQRFLIDSGVPKPFAGPPTSSGGPIATITSHTSAMLITASASCSIATRCFCESEISAGPDDINVRLRNGTRSSNTAARATCPPIECPNKCTGPPRNRACARTSLANSPCAYGASSTSGPYD